MSEMEQRVLWAADKKFPNSKELTAFYEHGQWWVEVDMGVGTDIHIYSVVVCKNEDGAEYLDFER